MIRIKARRGRRGFHLNAGGAADGRRGGPGGTASEDPGMKLPQGAWLVVADGERHLVLENRGDAERLDLRVVAEAPREGAARPGAFEAGRRERVEGADWRRIGRARFASELAGRLDAAAAEGAFPTLAVAGDARTLGGLRMRWSARVRARLAGEIAADLTHAPIPEIEAAVSRA